MHLQFGCLQSKAQSMLEVNKIHRRTLRVIYNYDSTYKELLANHNDLSIHQKHSNLFFTIQEMEIFAFYLLFLLRPIMA